MSRFKVSETSFQLRILVLALMLIGPLAAAEAPARVNDANLHGWYNYFGDHPLGNSRWGLHLEGQWRRADVVTRWQQLLLRPGVNFQVHPRLMLTAGYGFIDTFQYGEFPVKARFPEHRLWQQAQIRSNTGKLVWSTRLRFENRFLGVMERGSVARHRYENRFRALQRITVPLQGNRYFTAYDELFFYVPPYQSASRLDQNRIYAAHGWKLKPGWTVEAGYLQQTLLQRNGLYRELNHTFMVSVLSQAPFGHRE